MKPTALITGASSGIGKELAILHAQQGGHLILVARREEKLHEIKKELEEKYGVTVQCMPCDLTAPGAVASLVNNIHTQGLQVDYLINNAGFGGHGLFHEREGEQDLAMIQLNVVVLTELTRAFLPEMLERNAGKILNVSSTAGLPPGGPYQAVYFATKRYVTCLSYGIVGELEGTNVTLTTLLPGATETEFAQTSGMDKTDLFSKTASAASVAKAGYEGMLAGKRTVISGLSFSQRILMSLMPFLPVSFVLSEVKKMQKA